MQIKIRFEQSKMSQNEFWYEPKNPTTPTKDGSGGIDSNIYGGMRSKGYIRLGVYFKMRKLQIGNRWKTQFVTLHREEVKRLEYRSI